MSETTMSTVTNIDKIGEAFKEEENQEKEMTPEIIKGMLDEYVIGQDKAKMILSVAAYNHMKRMQYEDYKRAYPDMEFPELQKSNVLMLGATGSGKTLLARTLAKILGVPLFISDATKMTEAGYVGGNVEDCIKGLLQVSGYDMKKAEFGIVVCDEIDKLSKASGGSGKDVGGESVQQALLALMEGSIVNVETGSGYSKMVRSFDTTNVLFICSGAFAGISQLVARRTSTFSKSMGFGSTIERPKELSESELIQKVTPRDLVNYGMIPELIGRLPIKTKLETLTEDMLVKILTEPKDAPIRQYKMQFKMDGVTLEFDDDALNLIARTAIEQATGARGLRTIIENTMLPVVFKMPLEEKKFVVTKEMVEKSLEEL